MSTTAASENTLHHLLVQQLMSKTAASENTLHHLLVQKLMSTIAVGENTIHHLLVSTTVNVNNSCKRKYTTPPQPRSDSFGSKYHACVNTNMWWSRALKCSHRNIFRYTAFKIMLRCRKNVQELLREYDRNLRRVILKLKPLLWSEFYKSRGPGFDVFPVRYEHYLHKESKAIPCNKPWRRIGVSCEVRTSSTYKRLKLSP
jgi:hypothetical protein